MRPIHESMLRRMQALNVSPARLRAAAPSTLAILLIALFTVAYIRLTLQNVFHLRTGRDLGIYGQAFYHLSNFRLPFSSFKGGTVLWGDHAHFILVLLAPLYKLLPDIRTILIVQAIALTTSGWAMYRVARDTVRHAFFALAVLFSYLSFVGIQYALDFDFHPSVLTAAALAWAIYAAHFRRPVLYWIALVLGVLTREDAAPIFFLLGFYLLFRNRKAWAIPTMIVSAAYFFLVGYVIMPIWTPDHVPLAYLDVEDKNPFRIIRDIFVHTHPLLQNMVDTPEKVHTIRTLFASFGFLPLLSPFTYLASGSIFYSRFLSPNEYRWLIENHSNANILPILTYGAILGASNLLRLTAMLRRPWVQLTAAALLSLLLLGSSYATAWRHNDVPLRRSVRYESPEAQELARARFDTLQKVRTHIIPADASVSASSGFVAYLSDRWTIENYPDGEFDAQWVVLSAYINTWPLKRGQTETAFARFRDDPAYEPVLNENDIWVFRKRASP